MTIFDDKTKNSILSTDVFVYPSKIECEDITFKASYCVAADVISSGKIVALFDLTIIGDLQANELDVKGHFICTGKCEVKTKITVQGNVWANEIITSEITCREIIDAQNISVNIGDANGNIIVGRTLSVDGSVKSNQTIMCGETAFGSGIIEAEMVITGEPIDLDEGEESLISPCIYNNIDNSLNSETTKAIIKGTAKYKDDNNFGDYISFLTESCNIDNNGFLNKWRHALDYAKAYFSSDSIDEIDAAVLLDIIDVTDSVFFSGWEKINEWRERLIEYYSNVAKGKSLSLVENAPLEIDVSIGDKIRFTDAGEGVVQNVEKKPSGIFVTANFNRTGTRTFNLSVSNGFYSIEKIKRCTCENKVPRIICVVSDYAEWLKYLDLLNKNSTLLEKELHDLIFGILMGNLGLKDKYIKERFAERGWNIYVK